MERNKQALEPLHCDVRNHVLRAWLFAKINRKRVIAIRARTAGVKSESGPPDHGGPSAETAGRDVDVKRPRVERLRRAGRVRRVFGECIQCGEGSRLHRRAGGTSPDTDLPRRIPGISAETRSRMGRTVCLGFRGARAPTTRPWPNAAKRGGRSGFCSCLSGLACRVPPALCRVRGLWRGAGAGRRGTRFVPA